MLEFERKSRIFDRVLRSKFMHPSILGDDSAHSFVIRIKGIKLQRAGFLLPVTCNRQILLFDMSYFPGEAQVKLAASLISPLPLYFATFG
jgi:hypothetical protein